jgi:NAD-dependent deacetylase
MKKIAVITGAGVSRESGIETFRDKGGLWEQYDPAIYASARGWNINRDNMNEFYNLRRAELEKTQPNSAHFDLADLEKNYDVTIITQNIDNLHERAGSSNIIHLHGELTKLRNDQDPVYELTGDSSHWIDIKYGALDLEKNPDLRPAVVFFGEGVPMINKAGSIVEEADIVVVIGTSLQVYPAAGLLDRVYDKPIYVIDPERPSKDIMFDKYITHIKNTATAGMKELLTILNK